MTIHIKKANKGKLHQALHIKGKIPEGALEKASHSSSSTMRKRAQFALNARKWHHEEVEVMEEALVESVSIDLKRLSGIEFKKKYGKDKYKMRQTIANQPVARKHFGYAPTGNAHGKWDGSTSRTGNPARRDSVSGVRKALANRQPNARLHKKGGIGGSKTQHESYEALLKIGLDEFGVGHLGELSNERIHELLEAIETQAYWADEDGNSYGPFWESSSADKARSEALTATAHANSTGQLKDHENAAYAHNRAAFAHKDAGDMLGFRRHNLASHDHAHVVSGGLFGQKVTFKESTLEETAGSHSKNCQCEHEHHFAKEAFGAPKSHDYGEAKATEARKTPHGTFHVCRDCGEGHYKQYPKV